MFSPDDLGELQEARAGPSESDLTMPMIEGSPTALPSSLEDPSLDNVDREVFEMYYCKVLLQGKGLRRRSGCMARHDSVCGCATSIGDPGTVALCQGWQCWGASHRYCTSRF